MVANSGWCRYPFEYPKRVIHKVAGRRLAAVHDLDNSEEREGRKKKPILMNHGLAHFLTYKVRATKTRHKSTIVHARGFVTPSLVRPLRALTFLSASKLFEIEIHLDQELFSIHLFVFASLF